MEFAAVLVPGCVSISHYGLSILGWWFDRYQALVTGTRH